MGITRTSNSRGFNTRQDRPCGIHDTTSTNSGRDSMACILAGKLGTRASGVSGMSGSSSVSVEWLR